MYYPGLLWRLTATLLREDEADGFEEFEEIDIKASERRAKSIGDMFFTDREDFCIMWHDGTYSSQYIHELFEKRDKVPC
jgi:hypothetical protein